MAEFFYRETEGGSRRAMGPFETVDEARRAARYKGLLHVEIVTKSATGGYELVDGSGTPVGAQKAATAAGRAI